MSVLIIHVYLFVLVKFVITEKVLVLCWEELFITVLKLASIPGHTELTRWPYGARLLMIFTYNQHSHAGAVASGIWEKEATSTKMIISCMIKVRCFTQQRG